MPEPLPYACNCGRQFSDHSGVVRCRWKHEINLAPRVAMLTKICRAVLKDLDATSEGHNATPTVTDTTYTALRTVVEAEEAASDAK